MLQLQNEQYQISLTEEGHHKISAVHVQGNSFAAFQLPILPSGHRLHAHKPI